MLGPERLNWLLLMSAVGFHWWVSRLHPLYATYYRQMEPIAWLTEMVGPGDEEDDMYTAGSSSSSSGSGSGSSRSHYGGGTKGGPCMHEDGGRFAVFESTEGDPVSD